MEEIPERARLSGGIAADGPYWDGLAEGKFLLPRCAACKTWIWPANHRCAGCGSWEMEWIDLKPEGTVYSWTRSWISSDTIPERAADVPYVVVLAEIPAADNARVFGVLAGGDSGLAIDAPVRGIIDPPSAKTKGYATIRWQIIEND